MQELMISKIIRRTSSKTDTSASTSLRGDSSFSTEIETAYNKKFSYIYAERVENGALVAAVVLPSASVEPCN